MHPHFHVLLHVDKSYFKGTNYVKRDVWLNEWRKSYKDFNITQVDIRNLKQKNPEELKKSVCEVAKYAVKPNVFDPSTHPVRKTIALKALKQHLHGVHLQQAGGSIWFALKAVNATMDEETMELCDDNHIGLDCPVCNEELVKSWYKWQGTEYGLRRTANLGYLWSRDFKSLALTVEHLTFNQLSHTRSSKPCVHKSDHRAHNPEVDHKGLFQHQDELPQQSHKRSVGRSDPPPA
jgi:hypothetical protein